MEGCKLKALKEKNEKCKEWIISNWDCLDEQDKEILSILDICPNKGV